MKRCFTVLSLALALLLFSCDIAQNTGNVLTGDSVLSDSVSPDVSSDPYYHYSHTALKVSLSDTAFALFSSDTEPDCFTLFVPEGLIAETQTTIRVTSKNGEVVYEHIFPTSDLVNGYATASITNEAEMLEHVLSQANSILQDLSRPQTLSADSYLNQALPEDFERYDVYTALRKTERVLFHYCLNEESHYYLGYSDEEKKVVELIHCC